MVDVGPGMGALVIHTDDALRGQEIEISLVGHDSQRVHTDVLRRRTAGGFSCAAVFGSLAEADYNLWHRSRPGPEMVRVLGGQVVEVDWR
jgi:hypothetical protein